MEQITSRSNSFLAHIRKLMSDKAYRRDCGEMVCEGPKLLGEALRHGAHLTGIVQTKDADVPPLPTAVRRVMVPDTLLQWLSDTKTPQKLLFICRLPAHSAPPQLDKGHYLALDGLQDPGNLGTIWRTADAFGAAGLLLLPGCADPFSPKTIRAGMGVCFRLPVWEVSPGQLQSLVTAAHLPLYAAALSKEAVPLGSLAQSPAVVVIGSEGRGVSDAVLALCDKSLMIPMRPHCESLNAAVAASVILWEMAAQGLGKE